MYVDETEAACLAAAMLGLPEPDNDEQAEEVEDKFVTSFGIDLLTFTDMIERLLPLCTVAESPLTGNRYRGFAKDGCFIVKTEAS